MSVYKHVLIATDLSDENKIVVEKALKLAKLCDAKVSVIHVVEPLPGYGYAYVGIADIEAELRIEAKKSIELLAQEYHIPQENCHVELGPTKVELTNLIKKEKVDCVVVGSHGRHGFSELLGSTAHAAVHTAPCDVVTIRIKNA